MCGILGIGGPGGQELVRERIGDLHRRGPDDEGIWTSPDLTLGHRRLTIIGLDPNGRQPMASRSRRSLLAFNGEIYNYLEIADELDRQGRPTDRRFDTSVLIEALEAWGTDALPRLNGMFALAWYRPEERSLLLARDRWGKKPLFWGRVDTGGGRKVLAFSSELRTFATLPGGPPPCNPLGVARYLVYDGMPGDQTVYRDVYKVPAGSWVDVAPSGRVLREARYWAPHFEPEAIAPGAAIERAREALLRSLELRLRSDVPVGLFLSGGMDSSILAALWRRLRPGDRIRTFTVGFDDPSYDERRSARRMASHIGSEHHEISVTGRDLEEALEAVWNRLPEPFGDPSIVPTALLCRFAREHVKVALGGDGGDELQAGYDPFRAWRTARRMESVLPGGIWHRALKLGERAAPASAANLSLKFKLHHFAQGFLHPPEERVQGWLASFPVAAALAAMKPELARQVDPEEVLEPTRAAYRAAAAHGELHAQIATWAATYLESSILAKVDRASMMHSLEVRSPFLDPEVARSLTALPPSLIFRRGRGKALLRGLARDLLPVELLEKPKKGLGVPLSTWLGSILRPRLEEAIERSHAEGWFRAETIRRLWQEHRRGRYDHRKALWTFLFSFPFQTRR